MKKTPIKKKSSWTAAELAAAAFIKGGVPAPAIYTAFADRLRDAIEAPGETAIDAAAHVLEKLFREAAAKSPETVREAARGGEGETATAYALGKLAFAQLVAARAASSRADGRFLEHIRDPRYRPYVEALAEGPLSGPRLRQKVGERAETVSRKLAVLRELGIVLSRRQGNIGETMLTPGAHAALSQIAPAQPFTVPDEAPRSDVKAAKALADKRDSLPAHLRVPPTFDTGLDATRRKAA